MKTLTKALAAISLMTGMAAGTQGQTEPFKVGVCYDLSKAYTFATPQVAQAAQDLAKLINMKGGIGGEPVEVIVRDHGNEPQRESSATPSSAARVYSSSIPCPLRSLWLSCRGPWKTGVS